MANFRYRDNVRGGISFTVKNKVVFLDKRIQTSPLRKEIWNFAEAFRDLYLSYVESFQGLERPIALKRKAFEELKKTGNYDEVIAEIRPVRVKSKESNSVVVPEGDEGSLEELQDSEGFSFGEFCGETLNLTV